MGKRGVWRRLLLSGMVGLLLWIETPGLSAGQRIGVILLTQEHHFYQELMQGLAHEAKKFNFQIVILDSQFDAVRQEAQVGEMIAKKVDALIIAPCDSVAIGTSLLKANQAKIPVFTVDSANLSGKGKVIAHIGSDNREGGRQAGRLMAQALNGSGKVVIINHLKITSVMDRVAGFREYLANFPKIKIVADIPAWGQRDRAMAIMEDLLLMMPDLDGVFAINDDSALGTVKAIELAGFSGKIRVVGYDGTPEARLAVDQQKIYGEVIQHPEEISQLVIQMIDRYFSGSKPPQSVKVNVGIYTSFEQELRSLR